MAINCGGIGLIERVVDRGIPMIPWGQRTPKVLEANSSVFRMPAKDVTEPGWSTHPKTPVHTGSPVIVAG